MLKNWFKNKKTYVPIREASYKIDKYISEISSELKNEINTNNRILINSNPATGKTTFFADLAINLKKNNQNNRIVFLTPFLIIQDQLKTTLGSKGFGIDFILNATTTDKTLKPSYTIITSTFHSFYHISENLTNDDFVVVDEAHALLYNYKEDKRKRFYFDRVIPKLYHTQAKIILMTGTPLSGLVEIFNAKQINILQENPTKAKITVCYSSNKLYDIAIAFIEKIIYSDAYDSKKLNVIYIKDTKLCEKISLALNNLYLLKSKVLSSKHKGEEAYLQIVDEMTVASDIQWLITTNVISTGANIKNKNIGKALMLNEYSPLEIKQFSKRFREKLDIEVEVINSFNPNNSYEEDLITTTDIITERSNQRKYLNNILNNLINIDNSESNYSSFKYSFEKDYTGTPKHLINIVLERFTKQESYFEELLINSNYNADDLVNALNKYNDLEAVQDDSLIDYKNTVQDTTISDAINEILKTKTTSILADFIANETAYLKAIQNNIIIKDAYLKLKFDRYYNTNFSNAVTTNSIESNVLTTGFKYSFVNPIFEHIEQLQTASKSLYFEHSVNKNIQNKHKIAVYLSQLISKYYNQNTLKYSEKLVLKDKVLKNELSLEIQFTLDVIEQIFYYLLDKDFFHLKDLQDFITKSNALKKFRNYKGEFQLFPLNLVSKNGGFNSLTPNLLLGFTNGLFYLNKKQINRINLKGKSSKAFFFENDLPQKHNIKSKELDEDYDYISKKSISIKSFKIKRLKTKSQFIGSNKIISNPTLLNYIELGIDYYKLTK